MGGFRVTTHQAKTVIASCNACNWRSRELLIAKVMQEAGDHANHSEGHIVTAVATEVRIFKRVTTHTTHGGE